jgi:heme-degrading monooxygenase HmoA
MFIVEHKFTIPNGDITSHQANIIQIVQHKRDEHMQHDGFFGVNLETTDDNTCFTISVYWESEEIREAVSLVDAQAFKPIPRLQQYCIENGIIHTKVTRELMS